MTYALEIKNLKKVYQDGTVALDGVTLSVEQGEFFSLLGLNGAGKTTLIGIVTDLVRKTSGDIHLLGLDIDRQRSEAKHLIGLVPQEFNFNVFNTVEEVLVNYAGYFGISVKRSKERVDDILSRLKLNNKRETQVRFLSGGMKRRVMIARALIHDPKVLILDEPTAGVDVDLRRDIWDLLRLINKDGMTIILTSHYMEEVEALCKRVAILHKGTIVREGQISDIQKDAQRARYTVTVDRAVSKNEFSGITGVKIEAVENQSIHVTVEQSIHPLIEALFKNGYQIGNVYNRSNRLEKYFLADVKD